MKYKVCPDHVISMSSDEIQDVVDKARAELDLPHVAVGFVIGALGGIFLLNCRI